MAERTETTIPDNHVDFCRAIAAVCKSFSVDEVSMTFTPGWKDDWRNRVTMNWKQGRHGEESEQLHITSQVHVWTRIDGQKQERGRR